MLATIIMASIKTWENKWKKGDLIGKGGQGFTYFANDIASSRQNYAIKFLKEQKDKERRERMFLEVSALQVLIHPNIPRLIDSNEDKYQEIDHDLYLVTDYIPGPTLQEYIDQNGLMSLDLALKFSIFLAEIIEFCHKKGFIHRDIKPDNILIKNGNIKDTYLIDFGLSFNIDLSEQKDSTPSWQHIGNRFLSLPELRVSEGNKRDYRSDVTMLSGILFFCMTGIHPTDLIDEKLSKPHRREKAKVILETLEQHKISSLNKFFDIGFNQGINDRWQSIEAVKIYLTDILNMKPEEESEKDINEKLDSFKANIESRLDYKQLEQIRLAFSKCNSMIDYSAKFVIDKLKPAELHTIQTGMINDLPKQIFSNQLGIKNPYSEELIFYPKFTSYLNGSEFVFEAEESNVRTELARFQLNEDFDWRTLQDKVTEYYVNGITKKKL